MSNTVLTCCSLPSLGPNSNIYPLDPIYHQDCLSTWRKSSINPRSAYQCDSCNYRYSFRRTLYAQCLRSALMLHIVSFVCLVIIAILCGYIAKVVDMIVLGNRFSKV
jgi:hypothetical protein